MCIWCIKIGIVLVLHSKRMIISLRHTSILRRIWLNFMAPCLVFIRRLFQFSHFFFRISNFFDLSITEETLEVEILIWCIQIGKLLILHLTTGNPVYLISTKGSTAGVTGQQRMLTPPWHLILPSHLSEVRDGLHSIL
jgi:hypothetical protein